MVGNSNHLVLKIMNIYSTIKSLEDVLSTNWYWVCEFITRHQAWEYLICFKRFLRERIQFWWSILFIMQGRKSDFNEKMGSWRLFWRNFKVCSYLDECILRLIRSEDNERDFSLSFSYWTFQKLSLYVDCAQCWFLGFLFVLMGLWQVKSSWQERLAKKNW